MSTATLNRTFADFKVADLSLAEWGRKEISIAERARTHFTASKLRPS